MDPYSPVGLSANPRPKIGRPDGGHPAYEAYRPTALFLPNAIAWVAADEGSFDQHAPFPPGMSLGMNHGHSELQLVLGDFGTPIAIGEVSRGTSPMRFIFFRLFVQEQLWSEISPHFRLRRRGPPFRGWSRYSCTWLYSGGVDSALVVWWPSRRNIRHLYFRPGDFPVYKFPLEHLVTVTAFCLESSYGCRRSAVERGWPFGGISRTRQQGPEIGTSSGAGRRGF